MDRRQEGRRKHTAEQTQTDGRTDRRTYGGGGGWRDAEGGYVQFGCLCVWGLYMTYLGGEERSSQEHQGREEKRGRVWLNGILATTHVKVMVMLLFLV